MKQGQLQHVLIFFKACWNFLTSQKLSLKIQDAACYTIFVMTYKSSTSFPALLYVVVIRPTVAWLDGGVNLYITCHEHIKSILPIKLLKSLPLYNQTGHLFSEKLNYKPDSNACKNCKWSRAVCKIKCRVKTSVFWHCKKCLHWQWYC